jgi:hypothetical protein
MIPVEIYRDVVGNKDILGAYQLDKLELPTWRPFSYDKTFKEYGLVTGINNSKENFDMFIKSGNALNLIVHYNLTKDIDTPVGKRVVNTYTRLGSAIDKRGPCYTKLMLELENNHQHQVNNQLSKLNIEAEYKRLRFCGERGSDKNECKSEGDLGDD